MIKEEMIEEVEITKNKKKGKAKFFIMALLVLILLGGAGYGIYFLAHSANYVTTDNARITTTLVSISSNTQGRLERFNVVEGQTVVANEIIGWVEGGETMRSPFDGLVVQVNAVQNQTVSTTDTLAVIADTSSLNIQANIEETYIGKITTGMLVNVTLDGFGNRQFTGYVSEIGSVTDTELTGNAIFFNTGGTFTRVTHLLPVKINITDDINLASLIGTNARVQIRLDSYYAGEFVEQNNISITGTVESTLSRNIYTNSGLTIDNVYVEVGDFVTKGQILTTLDTSDIELAIAQQTALIENTRQSTNARVQDALLNLNDAQNNLQNNTNMQIVNAETALNTAQTALQAARENYNNLRSDYISGINIQVMQAESFLRNSEIDLATVELNHTNLLILYRAGAISSESLRQSENELTNARNQYNDAVVTHNSAVELQNRAIEQATINLQAADTAYENAHILLNAVRVAATQDIERLRNNVTNAQISTNLEHMEISLQLLEKELEDATIIAPISGTVTVRNAQEGAIGNGLLFTIENTENLRVITRFREYDLGIVYEGMNVKVTGIGEDNQQYTGIITRINPAAINDQNNISEFESEITITSENTTLLIGMNVRIYL